MSAHTISDSTPSTTPRVTIWSLACRDRRLTEGVKRTGPDVAIDDANAAECQRAGDPAARLAAMRLRTRVVCFVRRHSLAINVARR